MPASGEYSEPDLSPEMEFCLGNLRILIGTWYDQLVLNVRQVNGAKASYLPALVV